LRLLADCSTKGCDRKLVPASRFGVQRIHIGYAAKCVVKLCLQVSDVMRHCVALLMLFACSTASAETPWPLKTPTELRVLHGAGFAGFQILTYRVSEPSKQPDKSIVIGIGRDVIIRDDGRTCRVVDFRLGRLYDVDEHRRYVNSPIATEIVFRDTELGNRLGLGKALSAAGVGDKAADFVDAFWRATELKVTPPNDPPPGGAVADRA
jgi:hypothetical protein